MIKRIISMIYNDQTCTNKNSIVIKEESTDDDKNTTFLKCPACGKLHDETGELEYYFNHKFECDCGFNNFFNLDHVPHKEVVFIYSDEKYILQFFNVKYGEDYFDLYFDDGDELMNNIIKIVKQEINITAFNINDDENVNIIDYIKDNPNTMFLMYYKDDDVFDTLMDSNVYLNQIYNIMDSKRINQLSNNLRYEG